MSDYIDWLKSRMTWFEPIVITAEGKTVDQVRTELANLFGPQPANTILAEVANVEAMGLMWRELLSLEVRSAGSLLLVYQRQPAPSPIGVIIREGDAIESLIDGGRFHVLVRMKEWN